MKRIALLFAMSFALFAATEAPVGAMQSAVVMETLQGIVFQSSWGQVSKECEVESSRVVSKGVVLLSDHPGFLEELEEEFIGEPLTQGAIWKIKSDVSEFYCSHGQPFVVIAIPRQNPSKGILQIVVEEARLGDITMKGNKFSKPDEVREFVRGKPGAPIDGTKLVQDMTRMNQNLFRRTDAIFRPGKKPGTADLELATIDRWPYRFYMGSDNTGTIATERDRFFVGFNLGKTIVKDSEISYQWTTSPNWNRFSAQTALCRIPFPARQTFIFYGGYSKVEPELSDGRTEKSVSWQVDGRYRIPIITNTSFLQELILGFDFKQVIARIKQHSIVVFDDLADIDQFVLGYDLGHRSPKHRLTLVAEVYGSPGGMSHGNTKDKFVDFRAGSSPSYAYFKVSHSFAYKFIHFWASYDLNGQLSTKNLLPSEQFTLAGYNAVRGFEERIVNVDNALLVSVALQTPHVSISKVAGWTKRSFDELYFLGFFDFGFGGNTNPTKGESRTVNLASVGPGVRYQIDRYLTARFDYGFQLWHRGFDNPTHSRYNFGLIVSF
jgi:hemolysin activation/secretion protein